MPSKRAWEMLVKIRVCIPALGIPMKSRTTQWTCTLSQVADSHLRLSFCTLLFPVSSLLLRLEGVILRL